MKRITPCLWFDHQAEEAANYYCGVFNNSKIISISRYGEAGRDIHHRPAGSVMTVEFELDGQRFTALNGGPVFKFNEAVSLQIHCKDQAEIDYYWDTLGAGGDPKAQRCGWLKDKFGLSWQVIPADMDRYFADHTSPTYERVMNAMLKMKKIDLAGIQKAHAGQ